MQDFFDGIKSVAALDTLPTPTYGVAFFGNPRVDHLDVGGRTAWAFHKDVGVGSKQTLGVHLPEWINGFRRRASSELQDCE